MGERKPDEREKRGALRVRTRRGENAAPQWYLSFGCFRKKGWSEKRKKKRDVAIRKLWLEWPEI